MVEIRKIEAEDIPALAGIYVATYNNLGESWTQERAEVRFYDFRATRPDLAFLAQKGNLPIGATFGVIEHWYDGNVLKIGDLFVADEERGRNTGSVLFKKLITEGLREYGIVRCIGLRDPKNPGWADSVELHPTGLVEVAAHPSEVLRALS